MWRSYKLCVYLVPFSRHRYDKLFVENRKFPAATLAPQLAVTRLSFTKLHLIVTEISCGLNGWSIVCFCFIIVGTHQLLNYFSFIPVFDRAAIPLSSSYNPSLTYGYLCFSPGGWIQSRSLMWSPSRIRFHNRGLEERYRISLSQEYLNTI